MVRALGLRLKALKVTEFGLLAFRDELIAARLNFLLWSWNWVCGSIVMEWYETRETEGTEIRGRPERWTVEQWAQVLEPCAGREGDLLYDQQSVKVTSREEKTFAA